MSYQQERDQTLIELGRAGFSADHARRLLRQASTLHRLAEAQCNGDYPYNGSRDVYLHGDTREAREAWREKRYAACDVCGAECAKARLVQRRTELVQIPCPYCSAGNEPGKCAHCGGGDGQGGQLKRPRTVGGVCPDCRTQQRVRAILADGPKRCQTCGELAGSTGSLTGLVHRHGPTGHDFHAGPAWMARFQGDPRGGVLSIYPVGTPDEDIQTGRARGIGIPGRY